MVSAKKRTAQQRSPPPPQQPKRPAFISYLDVPNLPPKVKLLCDIIATTPAASVEKLLEDAGLRVLQSDVEDVLKLSYAFPGSAVKFFRWAGHQLLHKHSPYSWNLVVDLLGKNALFDAMWDAVNSMRREDLVSLATFASVFSSYVSHDLAENAIKTFEVMEEYGCSRDVVALNSLLSAICREGKTAKAAEFLRVGKSRHMPDADTYAILLEGWEAEGNVVCSRQTFLEMVSEIGWDPQNVPAYDSFLCTLLKGPDRMKEVMTFIETMVDRKCYPGIKFFNAALENCLKELDVRGSRLLWEAMVKKVGFKPDTQMCNLILNLYCITNNIDLANKFFDEMVHYGTFPNAISYNLLFQFYIKRERLNEASSLFNEMVKNECYPTQDNCSVAVKVFVDQGDPYVATRIWKFMVERYDSDLEETGNFLVQHLRDINMLAEAVKYGEDMIERGIKLSSFSLSKLRQGLVKARKEFVYEDLLRKWKIH